MKTLVLPPKFSAEGNALRKVASTRGWSVERLSSWNIPPHIRDLNFTVYAAPLFVAHLSEATGRTFAEPPDEWLLHLPPELLQRKVQAMPLHEARQIAAPAFIKPANFKTFKAGVYTSGAALPDEAAAPGDELTLISEIVHWSNEFRFFMLDGKALAGSVYFRDGATAEVDGEWPATEAEFAAARDTAEAAFAASATHLPRAVVIDTGLIRGKGYAVIEANPAWGSGLYGADPAAVLDVLEWV